MKQKINDNSAKVPNVYFEEAYVTIPTDSTKRWRKNFFWQIIRFFVLNFKMMKIVVGGHS